MEKQKEMSYPEDWDYLTSDVPPHLQGHTSSTMLPSLPLSHNILLHGCTFNSLVKEHKSKSVPLIFSNNMKKQTLTTNRRRKTIIQSHNKSSASFNVVVMLREESNYLSTIEQS
jgi:hypothetical protein